MTHIWGEPILLLVRFIVYITRRFGVNGILLLILLLQFPVMLFYYVNTQMDYQQEYNYKVADRADVQELSPEKDHLERLGVTVKKREHYYLAELQVNNLYSNEIRYLSVKAENQDGTLVDCRQINYYDASGNEGQEVIPAGAAGTLSCLITMTEEEMEQTDEIILRGWAIGEEQDSYTATIDFAFTL